ncbi:MAG: DUF4397 domain-containing protein [Planctomycetota bacterium]
MKSFFTCLAGFLVILSLAAPAHAADVYVVHGIPGADAGSPDPTLPVDISINGQCSLTNVLFKDRVGPIPLAAGQYQIDISLANPANPCSNPPVISATVTVGANENATIIAHLAADGSLTASKFTNDLSLPLFLHGRIVAHHTAAAPAVDIKLRRRGTLNLTADINGATNGAQAAADVFIGVWEGNIFPAGSHAAPVLGPIAGLVGYREAYFVYVVGSLQNGTLDKIVLPISF